MPSLMSIASSSLSSYKIALETVGNNIANVNTEGYSRQNVSFATQTTTKVGNSFVGNGVIVQDIKRQTNDLMTRLMHQSNADYNQYKTFYERSVIVDNLFSQKGTDVTENMETLFQALEQVNETPDSLPARNVFMEQAQFVADQFTNTQNILNETKANLNHQMFDIANHITGLSESIAETNKQIMAGSTSPKLLDERDQLILDLSQYMDVSTLVQSDGSMNVNIGKGESLIVGNIASSVTAGVDPQDGSMTLFLNSGNNTHEITKNIAGGMVEGLVDYEDNVLRETGRQLGVIAMAFAEKFNQQNKLGLDFDGQIGRNVFTDYNSSSLQAQRSYARTTNTDPTLQLSVKIDDYQLIENSDYELQMTGLTTGTLTRESDGQTFALGFSSGASPQITTVNGSAATSVEGFELNFASAPALGDYFNISPSDGMAGKLKLVQTDPASIALARPVRVYADLDNSSNGTIAIGMVSATDTTSAPNLSNTFQLRILDINTTSNDFSYEIYNETTASVVSGPLNADYGESITVPDAGYTVTLDGPVKVGDEYVAEFNSSGIADNSNGLLLSGIQQAALLNEGTETLFDRYSHLIANLGTETYQANVRQETADLLFKQSEAQKLGDVGVNLDEEAASLVSLQHAYQASAQLVGASKALMDIIFNMLR